MDTTYYTGTPYNTPDSLHTAGTLTGGAEKAKMLWNNFLQEIHLPRLPAPSWNIHGGGAGKAEMLQNALLQGTCLPRLPGHASQTDTLVPVRKTAA